MKRSLTVLCAIATIAGGLFLFHRFGDDPGRPDFRSASGEPHQDDRVADHDHGAVASDIRHSQLLGAPEYREPAGDPLVGIRSSERILAGPYRGARFAADGKHLLVSGEGFRGLWVARLDGDGMRQVSDGLMAGWRPVTTRDGRLIYRTADIDETGNILFSIVLHDLESGSEEVLYRGLNEDVYPPWLSRDEDAVFIRKNGGIATFALVEEESLVAREERDEGIAYSDGGRVWYERLDGENSVALTPPGGEAFGGEVASPCGRYVAYLSGNTNSVIIADIRMGTEVDIGEGANLAWHPEGSLLLYDVSADDGHRLIASDLFAVEPDGGNRQRVTFDPDIAFHNPAWSPDGRAVLAEDALTGEIYRLEVETP